jgi:PilZ domain
MRAAERIMRIGLDFVTYSKAPEVRLFKSQKRAERRMKRDFHAQVMLGGFARRDCKVVDISKSGARIAISGAIELPRQFSIAFASTDRPCQLVWRNGTMAGVKFLK